jgi:hypothetical protein
MNENEQLKEILATKEAKLIKKQAWLDEVGMDTINDDKLARKRFQVRREISELKFNIKDLKEMLAE